MASKSTPGLLAAIEGFSGEHAGSPQHESTIALLQRAKAEMDRGHASPPSPGKQAAQQAAEARMPAEAAHSGGAGNKTSNEPGSADAADPTPDLGAGSKGATNMANAGVQGSAGELRPNLPGAPAADGVVDFRRQAALAALEHGPSSEGNATANTPGRAAGNEARTGDVKAPAKEKPDRNKAGASEKPAPFAQEQASDHDGDEGSAWAKARAAAKKSLAGSRS